MPRAPVLRNTCHGPRTSIPQRAGCLPPHTDRVQQDTHPPDSPAPSAQKSENAMWGTTSRPTTRKKPARAQLCHRRCSGQLRQPAPRRRPSTTGITTTSPAPSLAPFACPVAAPPTTADARGAKTETMSPPPERSPRGAHAAPCPATAAPPFPSPRHDDGLRGKPDFLSEAHGPSTVALQQRCHRASAPARRPS